MTASYNVFGDKIIIEVSGKLSIESLHELERVWDECISLNPSLIAFDFSVIEFIDSSAIGTLVKFSNNAAKINVKMVFLDLSETTLMVFESAKLDRMFKIYSRAGFEKDYGILK